jgi:hypothetical protein
MTRWLVPGAGALVLIVAVALGVYVWSTAGDAAASCDQAALDQSLRDGIRAAGQQGATQFTLDRPAGCTDTDIEDAVPAVTRTWHAMAGGILMREAAHPAP